MRSQLHSDWLLFHQLRDRRRRASVLDKGKIASFRWKFSVIAKITLLDGMSCNPTVFHLFSQGLKKEAVLIDFLESKSFI